MHEDRLNSFFKSIQGCRKTCPKIEPHRPLVGPAQLTAGAPQHQSKAPLAHGPLGLTPDEPGPPRVCVFHTEYKLDATVSSAQRGGMPHASSAAFKPVTFQRLPRMQGPGIHY